MGLERGQWGLVQEQYLPAGKKTGPWWLTKQGAVRSLWAVLAPGLPPAVPFSEQRPKG